MFADLDPASEAAKMAAAMARPLLVAANAGAHPLCRAVEEVHARLKAEMIDGNELALAYLLVCLTRLASRMASEADDALGHPDHGGTLLQAVERAREEGFTF